MCTGRTHALHGAVAGSALSIAVLHANRPAVALAALVTAGAAVLPDVDHADSTIAHTFGLVTQAFAWIVGRLSGGHRHLTHSLSGVAVFTGLAFPAGAFRHTWPGRIGLAVLLTLLFASALRALKLGGHSADLLAGAAAAAMVWTGYGAALVPYAVAAGCLTHIAGDMCTDSGCPVLAPLSREDYRLIPEPFAFTTGTRPETLLVRPLLVAALTVMTVLLAACQPAGTGRDPAATVVPPRPQPGRGSSAAPGPRSRRGLGDAGRAVPVPRRRAAPRPRLHTRQHRPGRHPGQHPLDDLPGRVHQDGPPTRVADRARSSSARLPRLWPGGRDAGPNSTTS